MLWNVLLFIIKDIRAPMNPHRLSRNFQGSELGPNQGPFSSLRRNGNTFRVVFQNCSGPWIARCLSFFPFSNGIVYYGHPVFILLLYLGWDKGDGLFIYIQSLWKTGGTSRLDSGLWVRCYLIDEIWAGVTWGGSEYILHMKGIWLFIKK